MSCDPRIDSPVVYRFDRFELFPDAGQLRRSGTLIHLAPQPFRVLLMLVERQGAVVTRDEIQEELWGGETYVDFDQSINAVIRRIRTALHDHAETPRFLQTIPRRGYCFVAPVERIDPNAWRASFEMTHVPEPAPSPDPQPIIEPVAPTPTPQRRPMLRLAIAFLSIAPVVLATHAPLRTSKPEVNATRALRVAITPVEVDGVRASIDPRLVSMELRSRLGQVQPERIQVTDANTPADMRIETVLHGLADGIRVDARIVEVPSGRRVWSESFHRAGDAQDFPLEVALRVTRAFVLRYVPPPRNDIMVHTRVSPRVLAIYHEAREIRGRPAPQRDLERALTLFAAVVKEEPRFGEAWSAIGDIWAERALQWSGSSRRMAIARSREALDRAIALTPECTEALNDRALLAVRFDRAYAEGERGMRAAIKADDAYNDAHVNLALLLSAMGQHDEALAEIHRAQMNDPAMFSTTSMRAFLYLMARRYGDASAEYHAVLLDAQQRPDIAHWGLISAAIGAKQWNDASASLSAMLGEPIVIPADAADPEAIIRKEMRRLEAGLLEREHNRQIDPYAVACFYAQISDADLAIAALDRAIESQSLNAMFALVDPRLDRIRADPRFGERLERLSLQH